MPSPLNVVSVRPLLRFRPLRADLGQLRIFLDLDPPALVLGQVPVKIIELILRHQVDVLFNELDRHKMPRDIEMHAAVAETSCSLILPARNRRDHLCLSAIAESVTEALEAP